MEIATRSTHDSTEADAHKARREKDAAPGALHPAMAGRVRPLPITKAEARRFRRAADLSATDFEAKLRRTRRRAPTATGRPPSPAAPPRPTM